MLLRGAILWGVALLPGVAVASADPGGTAWWELGGGLLLGGVIAVLSQARPLLALPVAVALSLWEPWWGAVMVVMAYLVGRRVAQVLPVGLTFGAAATLSSAVALRTGQGVTSWFTMVTVLTFAGVLPWLAGRYRRLQAELVLTGWERAALLEREQRLVADQARLRERGRIAQDMHDTLGHELSLIAVRAGALEVASGHGGGCRAAAGALRASVGAATDRLGEIIEVLGDDRDDSGVAGLVERATAAGVPVELRREGDAGRVPTTAGHAAYRVVQESLTNAAKHAPGAAVVVRLAYRADEVVVTVTNQARPRGPSPSRRQHGLAGLRERVRLAGGTLRTGHRDGGFEVSARLPYTLGVIAPAGTDGATPSAEAPPSARHLVTARRRARRGLVAAAGIPLVLGMSVMAVQVGYQARATARSVLAVADFTRLRLGQERADVRPLLPARQVPERPSGPEPPAPAGAVCEYYAITGDPFSDLAGDAYRLCFAGGRLVAKDVLSAAGE